MPDVTPEPYWYWLKTALRMPLPMRADWDGLLDALLDIAGVIFRGVTATLLRLLILVTLPISAPLLAWWFAVENRKVAKRKKEAMDRAREQMIGKGMP